MTNTYDQLIKHLGHPIMINARGSSRGEKPRACIKCMKCDEIIVTAIDPRVTITAASYEVNERRHDETTN